MSPSKYYAEFLGTFFLVFLGAGAVLSQQLVGNLGTVGVAFAHGIALMVAVYAFGWVSGAHVNPAVTIAFWASRRMPSGEALRYIVSQLLGGVFAALLLLMVFPGASATHLGVPEMAPNVDFWQGAAFEAVLTFFLVMTVFGVVCQMESKAFSGLAIGFILGACILVAGDWTGGALNPARAFGPALMSGFWANQAAYWLGPIFGALVAAWVYPLVCKPKTLLADKPAGRRR